MEPNNGVYLIDRAREYRWNNELQNALADYNKGLAIKPKDANGLEGRGETKPLLGDFAGAVADFTAAIGVKPADWADEDWCHVHRGMAEMSNGDLTAALADFNKVLAIEPHYADALFGRGLVQLKQGQKDAAQKDFDMAVAAQPGLKDKVADALKSRRPGHGRPPTTTK